MHGYQGDRCERQRLQLRRRWRPGLDVPKSPAVCTFLHRRDWQGKTAIPFMTNGGWPGHVIKDMEKACARARCVLPMQVQFDSTGGSRMETPQKDVDRWVDKVRKILDGADC